MSLVGLALTLGGCDGAPVSPSRTGPAAGPSGLPRAEVTPSQHQAQTPGRSAAAHPAPAPAAIRPAKPVAGSMDPAALTAQKEYPRVRAARRNTARAIEQLFARRGIRYPAHRLFIRVFKADDRLELWAQPAADQPFKHLKNYPVCARSGRLGPKRRAGDRQVPEGFYHIDRFNPASSYHLSLGLDYPNASDKILSDPDRPGGDIFIHGDCRTIGCVPITDELIEELYIIALDSSETGRRVAVHVFPTRMVGEAWDALRQRADPNALFWDNIRPGFLHFDQQKRLPTFSVDSQGRYLFR